MKHLDQVSLLVGAIILVLCLSVGNSSAQRTIVLDNYVQPEVSTDKVSATLLALDPPTSTATTNGRSAQPSDREISLRNKLSPSNQVQVYNGRVVVEALATPGQTRTLERALRGLGARNVSRYEHQVSCLLPIDRISQLSDINALQYARPVPEPTTDKGSVTSRGDIVLKSDQAREIYGVDGKGIKVGILSDSYNNLDGEKDGIASGDLPRRGVRVLQDLPGGGSDEGRGMAELVHDVAPGAQLFFRTAFLGQADFALGIDELVAAGCNVIVDDIGYRTAPFFQDGVIAQAADRAFQKGVAYFSSAGNSGRDSYESPFNNSGIQLADAEGNVLGFAHDFGGGDIFQDFVLEPSDTAAGDFNNVLLSLQWDDPSASVTGGVGADTDLGLYFIFPSLDNFVLAVDEDNIELDPLEFGGVRNPFEDSLQVRLVITKKAGPDPALIKYINFGNTPIEDKATNSPTVFGHKNARGAIAVGASAWFFNPRFDETLSRPLLNDFSSVGGVPILFRKNGTRLGTPDLRFKPEVTGPDGGNTTFFGRDLSESTTAPGEPDGFPNFFGTSASAPHVAAVAALMQEAAFGALSPRTIEVFLQRTATDMDNPYTPGLDQGFDFATGAGFVQADEALALVNEQSLPTMAITPIVERVVFDANRLQYKAVFGYENQNPSLVVVPVGEDNKFVPGRKNRRQVTNFRSGRQQDVFEVFLERGQTLTWTLKGPDNRVRTVTATAPGVTPVATRSGRGDGKGADDLASLADEPVNVYPTVTTGAIHLEAVTTEDASIRVAIFNTIGQQVYSTTAQHYLKETTNLSQYGRGFYLVNFQVGDQTLRRKALVE